MRSKAACFVIAAVLVAPPAYAQDREQDAERLFQEGQKLLAERRYGEACPKLEQAYQKDKQLGTLLNLAYCHKEQGANWQAWLEFREAEIKATDMKMKERRDFATKSRIELEKGLARVVVDVKDTKAELTEVLVEERKVPEAERGLQFVAEPGQRKFTFKAKGKKPAQLLVAIKAHDKSVQHVGVPAFEDDTGPSPSAAKESPSEPSPSAPAKDVEPESDGSQQRFVAYGLFGLAAVGIGVGAVTGLQALNSPCSKDPPSDPEQQRQHNADCKAAHDADNTSATVSTISFAVAGTALAAGLFVFFTAPKGSTASSARVRPVIGLGYAGVDGRF